MFGTSAQTITPTVLVPLTDPFGTLDPFGSGSFSSAEGFADFSQMSKVRPSEEVQPQPVSTCV